MALTTHQNFIYFHKGEFPCMFLLEVQEGFARFDVKDEDSLTKLMTYAAQKNLHVNWARAVANDAKNRKAYKNYPGGKYVASTSPVEERSA
jgi:hypothetical protein